MTLENPENNAQSGAENTSGTVGSIVRQTYNPSNAALLNSTESGQSDTSLPALSLHNDLNSAGESNSSSSRGESHHRHGHGHKKGASSGASSQEGSTGSGASESTTAPGESSSTLGASPNTSGENVSSNAGTSTATEGGAVTGEGNSSAANNPTSLQSLEQNIETGITSVQQQIQDILSYLGQSTPAVGSESSLPNSNGQPTQYEPSNAQPPQPGTSVTEDTSGTNTSTDSTSPNAVSTVGSIFAPLPTPASNSGDASSASSSNTVASDANGSNSNLANVTGVDTPSVNSSDVSTAVASETPSPAASDTTTPAASDTITQPTSDTTLPAASNTTTQQASDTTTPAASDTITGANPNASTTVAANTSPNGSDTGSTAQTASTSADGTTPRTAGTPFASTSVFNMPLGTGAQWQQNSQLEGAGVYVNTVGNYNENIYTGTASDPLVTVTNDAAAGGTPSTLQVHIPVGAVPAGGNDRTFTVDDTATGTWDSFGGFQWTGTNTATASQASSEPINGSGITQSGSDWDEGVGTLTSADLQAGTIDHMLRMELPTSMLESYDPTNTGNLAPYAWPQTQEDGFANNGDGGPVYSGTVPYGVTIGIPQGTPEPTDVADNAGANMLWQALEDHGAMVRDSGGNDNNVIFQADQNVDPNDPLIQGMDQYGAQIMAATQILTNQGPNSINGGGTPVVPLDAPIS